MKEILVVFGGICYRVYLRYRDHIRSLPNCSNKTFSERVVKYITYWFCDGVREFFKIQFGMASGSRTLDMLVLESCFSTSSGVMMNLSGIGS